MFHLLADIVPIPFADIVSFPTGGGDFGTAFPIAAGLTLVIEMAVVYLMARKVFHLENPFGRIAAAGTVPSLVTLAAIAIGLGALAGSLPGYIALEAGVIAVEAAIIMKLLQIDFKPAASISAAANLTSIVLGFIILGF